MSSQDSDHGAPPPRRSARVRAADVSSDEDGQYGAHFHLLSAAQKRNIIKQRRKAFTEPAAKAGRQQPASQGVHHVASSATSSAASPPPATPSAAAREAKRIMLIDMVEYSQPALGVDHEGRSLRPNPPSSQKRLSMESRAAAEQLEREQKRQRRELHQQQIQEEGTGAEGDLESCGFEEDGFEEDGFEEAAGEAHALEEEAGHARSPALARSRASEEDAFAETAGEPHALEEEGDHTRPPELAGSRASEGTRATAAAGSRASKGTGATAAAGSRATGSAADDSSSDSDSEAGLDPLPPADTGKPQRGPNGLLRPNYDIKTPDGQAFVKEALNLIKTAAAENRKLFYRDPKSKTIGDVHAWEKIAAQLGRNNNVSCTSLHLRHVLWVGHPQRKNIKGLMKERRESGFFTTTHTRGESGGTDDRTEIERLLDECLQLENDARRDAADDADDRTAADERRADAEASVDAAFAGPDGRRGRHRSTAPGGGDAGGGGGRPENSTEANAGATQNANTGTPLGGARRPGTPSSAGSADRSSRHRSDVRTWGPDKKDPSKFISHPALTALGMGKKYQRAWIVLDDFEDDWWEENPLPLSWDADSEDPPVGSQARAKEGGGFELVPLQRTDRGYADWIDEAGSDPQRKAFEKFDEWYKEASPDKAAQATTLALTLNQQTFKGSATPAVSDVQLMVDGIKEMAQSSSETFKLLIEDRKGARKDTTAEADKVRTWETAERAADRAAADRKDQRQHEMLMAAIQGSRTANAGAASGAGSSGDKTPVNQWGDNIGAMLRAANVREVKLQVTAELLDTQDLTPDVLCKGIGKRGSEKVLAQLVAAGLTSGIAGQIVDVFLS